MKRTLILIHLALSIAFIGNSISMKAQTKDTIQTSCVLRYYASLEDIKNDHWTEIILKDSISTIHKNNEGNLIDDRNFIIKDKAVRKIINKKAIAIKCDSTILLNLRFIRCKGSIGSMGRDFARAYPLKDGRFIMAYYDVKKVGVEWAIKQGEALLKAGFPILHFYTMTKTEQVKQIVEELWPLTRPTDTLSPRGEGNS